MNDNHQHQGHRQRLRERFLAGGLSGFHDYEVIELLLTLNTPRRDCKQAAKDLIQTFGSFQSVLEAPREDLASVKGVGEKNSLGISLIKAAADRYLENRIASGDIVNCTRDLLNYLHHSIGFKDRELVMGIFLDAKNRVLASETLFEGTLTASAVYPRQVVAKAIRHKAAALILAHNHPSGDVTPSDSDRRITRRLFFALGFVDIRLYDHIIVGTSDYYSFAGTGYMDSLSREFQTANG